MIVPTGTVVLSTPAASSKDEMTIGGLYVIDGIDVVATLVPEEDVRQFEATETYTTETQLQDGEQESIAVVDYEDPSATEAIEAYDARTSENAVPLVPLLDDPVPQIVEQLVAVIKLVDSVVPEQIIAVPKISWPSQSQLSLPQSSGHHISMEHRLRRKQLNSDTNASNKSYLKEIQEKKKRRNFFLRKMKKRKMKNIKKSKK